MNINAIIANTGNGSVTTGNISTGDITQEINVTSEQRKEFFALLKGIKQEVEALGDSTAIEAVDLIQEETMKESWNKKIMKFALDTVQKTGVALAAKGLYALASKAISLLTFI